MKIAIPYWQDRISPVFDNANRLLLVNIENGREIMREETQIMEKEPLARVKYLHTLGADVLICGAISRSLQLALDSEGITVIAQICGPVDEVINAYTRNQLTDQEFFMPGCCSHERKRQRSCRSQKSTDKSSK
jgi:predicted Fe-Mo cluster-binding NifX family protein